MLEADVLKFRKSIMDKDRESLINVAVENYRRCGELSAQIKEHEKENHEFFLQFAEIKDRLAGARREIETLRKQNEHLTEQPRLAMNVQRLPKKETQTYR